MSEAEKKNKYYVLLYKCIESYRFIGIFDSKKKLKNTINMSTYFLIIKCYLPYKESFAYLLEDENMDFMKITNSNSKYGEWKGKYYYTFITQVEINKFYNLYVIKYYAKVREYIDLSVKQFDNI